MAKEENPQTREGQQDRSGMTEQAKEKASEMGEQARKQVTSQLDAQKDRASEQLGTVSSALRQTSSNLREEDEDLVADYIESAAHQVDRFSDYVRTHSVSDLFSEVERYARRQPSLFLGGAVLAGFMGARFLKSTSPEHRRGRHTDWERSRRMQPGTRFEERSYREPPQGARGYSQVHGTSGGEMPEPGRGTEEPTPEVAPQGVGQGGTETKSEERRR